MSVAEAQTAVRLANTGEKSQQFFEAAMKSGRFEIIEVCWEGTYTSQMLCDAMKNMPESPVKEQLVSKFLRNPRIAWPPESQIAPRGEWYRGSAVNFIIPLVRRHLPDAPMDYSVISTREKRLKLADAFDTAAGIPIEREPDAKRVWPPKPGDKPLLSTAFPVLDDAGTAREATAPVATVSRGIEPAPHQAGWAMWAVCAAILVATAGFLARRFRSGTGSPRPK